MTREYTRACVGGGGGGTGQKDLLLKRCLKCQSSGGERGGSDSEGGGGGGGGGGEKGGASTGARDSTLSHRQNFPVLDKCPFSQLLSSHKMTKTLNNKEREGERDRESLHIMMFKTSKRNA